MSRLNDKKILYIRMTSVQIYLVVSIQNLLNQKLPLLIEMSSHFWISLTLMFQMISKNVYFL